MVMVTENMSDSAREIAGEVDWQLDEYKDSAQAGVLEEKLQSTMIRTVESILDNQPVKLTEAVRTEVLNWFQAEYGICL